MNIDGIYDGDNVLAEMAEVDLHKFFHAVIKSDFYTAHEVDGVCFLNHPSLENPRVRADFLLYPRKHLVDAGFAETWFAVEIKTSKKMLEDAMRQAFWYSVSQFELKNKKIVPGFAVAWMPSRQPLNRFDLNDESLMSIQRQREWYEKGVKSAFSYLNNVGTMNLKIRNYLDWEIRVNGRYACKYDSKECRLHVSRDRKRFSFRHGNGQKPSTHF